MSVGLLRKAGATSPAPGRAAWRGLWRAGLLLLACLPHLAEAALPIERWQTGNGVPVHFVRVTALPMFDVEVRFDAGSRLDPPGLTGLAGFTASLLDAGAGDRTEQQVADAFAAIGALRGSGAGDDSASVSLRSLSAAPQREAALALLADLIERPAFDEAALARDRERALQSLRRSANQPGVIRNRAFYRLAYPGHPYGRSHTQASIQAIDRAAVVAFHARHYVASRAIVAIVGDLTRDQAGAMAEQLVGSLPVGTPGNDLPAVRVPAEGIEEFIAHPAQQSHVITGTALIERGDPDYFPLLLANQVLGGASFISRLYEAVRNQRGLAYSVGSSLVQQAQPGPFTISLQTRRDQTATALGVVRDVLARFVDEGPSEAELAAARGYLVGSFALQMDTNGQILDLVSSMAFHRLPNDYLERWPREVEAVTLEQVREVLRRRLDPSRLVTVVVGENPFAGAR